MEPHDDEDEIVQILNSMPSQYEAQVVDDFEDGNEGEGSGSGEEDLQQQGESNKKRTARSPTNSSVTSSRRVGTGASSARGSPKPKGGQASVNVPSLRARLACCDIAKLTKTFLHSENVVRPEALSRSYEDHHNATKYLMSEGKTFLPLSNEWPSLQDSTTINIALVESEDDPLCDYHDDGPGGDDEFIVVPIVRSGGKGVDFKKPTGAVTKFTKRIPFAHVGSIQRHVREMEYSGCDESGVVPCIHTDYKLDAIALESERFLEAIIRGCVRSSQAKGAKTHDLLIDSVHKSLPADLQLQLPQSTMDSIDSVLQSMYGDERFRSRKVNDRENRKRQREREETEAEAAEAGVEVEVIQGMTQGAAQTKKRKRGRQSKVKES